MKLIINNYPDVKADKNDIFKRRKRGGVLRGLLGAVCLLMAGMALTGCDDLVYDDQGDCDPHYKVRFRYDMNMKWADAFPSEVKEVTLYVIDDETGHVVWSRHESGEELEKEGYLMDVDVAPGRYSLMAWCGQGHTTHFDVPQVDMEAGEATHHTTLTARLGREHEADGGAKVDHYIKGLYHGRLEAQDFPDEEGTHVYTVSLTKDTNNVQVVLQHLSGEPVDETKFHFSITSDNGYMAHDNSLIADEKITYHAWDVKGGMAGVDVSDPETTTRAVTQVNAAVAELSVPRLVKGNETTLNIHNDKGEKVVSVPLIDYALLVKGNSEVKYGRKMTDQEFLDRQDEYYMVFFLDEKDKWYSKQVYIISWMIVNQESEL